jgi:hypothetical protein
MILYVHDYIFYVYLSTSKGTSDIASMSQGQAPPTSVQTSTNICKEPEGYDLYSEVILKFLGFVLSHVSCPLFQNQGVFHAKMLLLMNKLLIHAKKQR